MPDRNLFEFRIETVVENGIIYIIPDVISKIVIELNA